MREAVEFRRRSRTAARVRAGTATLPGRGEADFQPVRDRRLRCEFEAQTEEETAQPTFPAESYSRSGNCSRGILRPIDRPWPGTRSMKPLASSVSSNWCTEGGVTRKYRCMSDTMYTAVQPWHNTATL